MNARGFPVESQRYLAISSKLTWFIGIDFRSESTLVGHVRNETLTTIDILQRIPAYLGPRVAVLLSRLFGTMLIFDNQAN